MERLRVGGIAFLLTVLLASCGDDGGDRGAAGKPVRGGTLVVAITEDPGMLNPAVSTSGAVHTASEIFFNGLVERDEDGRPQPELAERWDVENDGALYRFHLRRGVQWHDGRPFTSADVKFTFEEALLKYHARTTASLGPVLQGIETPDEQTVEFRFKQPYSPLLLQLDVTEAPILPKHVFETADPQAHPANSKPVGTGPYKFESYSKGSEIRATRNPNYWREGAYLDRVVMRVIPETATQLLALEQGEVDYLWSVPGPELERVQKSDELETAQTAFNPGGSNCIMTVSFNLERPALQDVRVRKAIAHAIDRQRFVEQVLFGQGRVAAAPISSRISWAHAEGVEMPSFDRAQAEQLLDQAGWKREGQGTRRAQGVRGIKNGTPLRLTFLHFPTFAKYGELVREQLRGVGIDVQLRALEPPVFIPTVFEKRDFDTNVISYCNGPDPHIGVRRMYHSSLIRPVPFTNAASYSNERVDELFDQAARVAGEEERGRLYREAQGVVVRDLPYFWLVETESTRGWRSRCTGFRPWTGLFAERAFCRR